VLRSSREHRSGYDSQPENERLAQMHYQAHLHTNNLGIITALNNNGKRADVRVAQFKMHNGQDITVDLPDLPVHPVLIGDFFLDAKLNVGQECRIHYCERNIRSFLRSGRIGRVTIPRFHDIADGYIVPTCMSESAVAGLSTKVGLLKCISDLSQQLINLAGVILPPGAGAQVIAETTIIKTKIDLVRIPDNPIGLP